MNIVIFTIGTQGDARPFVALGRQLKELGHEVTIATDDKHGPLIEGGGLKHAPLTSDFVELMSREQGAMDKGQQIKATLGMRKAIIEWLPSWITQGQAAAKGADFIIGSGSGTVLAASVAEQLGVDFVQAQFFPMTPSRYLPPIWPSPSKPLPGPVSLALGLSVRFLLWRFQAGPANTIRRALGLQKLPFFGSWVVKEQRRRRHILYAFSRHLLPQPPDWPKDQFEVTGNWFYEEATSWEPPSDLVEFLDRGPKPIYIGFGSMMQGNTVEFARLIADTIKATGQRAVILTGWGAIDPETIAKAGNPDIYCAKGAPHDWLLPRVKLAITHGGAGTIAAAARVGIPQIILPFAADQPFWRYQTHQIGINPIMLERKTLDRATLALAIERALTPEVVERARALKEGMDQEDGIQNAIDALRRWKFIP